MWESIVLRRFDKRFYEHGSGGEEMFWMDLREMSTELLCSLKGNPLRCGNQFSSESCMKVSCFLPKIHLQSRLFMSLVAPDFSAINITPILTRWDRLEEACPGLTPIFLSRGRVA